MDFRDGFFRLRVEEMLAVDDITNLRSKTRKSKKQQNRNHTMLTREDAIYRREDVCRSDFHPLFHAHLPLPTGLCALQFVALRTRPALKDENYVIFAVFDVFWLFFAAFVAVFELIFVFAFWLFLDIWYRKMRRTLTRSAKRENLRIFTIELPCCRHPPTTYPPHNPSQSRLS